MSTIPIALKDLIREASTELGSDACRSGKHLWESDGCRGCPHDDDSGQCGQAVYRCTVCGQYDYGEPGGPGATDCAATRGCDFRHMLAAAPGITAPQGDQQ